MSKVDSDNKKKDLGNSRAVGRMMRVMRPKQSEARM